MFIKGLTRYDKRPHKSIFLYISLSLTHCYCSMFLLFFFLLIFDQSFLETDKHIVLRYGDDDDDAVY